MVEIKNISFSYGKNEAVKNISFDINPGECVGVLGNNGSGKSSIVERIIGRENTGITCSGTFRAGSGLVVSYVPQDASFLRGGLSIFAKEHGLDESLFKALLRKLDFSREQFETDMSDFSEGQKKKTLIAKSLCERAHLYVWDEPLNFIDVFSRVQIEELLLQFAPTILFVEHDGAFCENVGTKRVWL